MLAKTVCSNHFEDGVVQFLGAIKLFSLSSTDNWLVFNVQGVFFDFFFDLMLSLVLRLYLLAHINPGCNNFKFFGHSSYVLEFSSLGVRIYILC